MRRGVGLLAVAVVFVAAAPDASAAGPLRTAIFDPFSFDRAERQPLAFARTRAAGATMVRLTLYWTSVAPQTLPSSGFDPTDPMSPHYNWGWFDREVQQAVARGLEPFVEIMHAPRWAAGGPDATVRPNPGAFGAFARAAALRYSGAYSGLPRIRYWQAWGEPNRDYFLMPQYEGGRIASALHYREMVRHFSAAVHGVNPTNQVIAGALAPVARRGKPAPLAFLREMLCLSRSLRPTCSLAGSPVEADVWSHHAYTIGGPTRWAAGRDSVSLGDLHVLRRYLRAAVRHGHIRPRGRLQFWVTEFGWDSSPPDPMAIPTALHARWTSHALYQMWRNGVSVATWWLINDNPLRTSRYQSGLYTVRGRAKRSLTAFRFPVVAFRRNGRVYVWGRTPTSRRGTVRVQINRGSGWRNLGRLRANGSGIFARTYRVSARRGHVRARFGRAASVPFSLTSVRDRVVEPFGCGGETRCR